MSEKSIVRMTSEEARASAQAWAREHVTPEWLMWFDSLTDEDIAGQERGDPYYMAVNAYPRFLKQLEAERAAAAAEQAQQPAK